MTAYFPETRDDRIFHARYFERNAEMRVALSQLEFMLWKRGKFIIPTRKKDIQSEFLKEEIGDFYERGIMNLPQLQFAITTHCTLRCANCNALIPYFGKNAPHYTLSANDFSADLHKLETCVNKIRRFQLLGGEPLLHPHLGKLVRIAAASPMINIVEIVSNGTVLPGSDLLEALTPYRDKLYFHISNYSANPQLRERLVHAELFARLKEYGFKYLMSEQVSWNAEYPFSPTGIESAKARQNFAACWLKRTLEVKNHKIAICPKASSGYELGQVAAVPEGEVVDLSDKAELMPRLVAFFQKPCFEVCLFCKRSGETVIPAEQLA